MTGILSGIKVLDLSRFISGPFCTMLLSDFDAEVIRIERPGGEDDRRIGPFAPNGESMGIMVYGRNKKGITLNLRSEKGKELFRGLVKRSDIVVENFTTGYMDSLGLGYEKLKELNPGIIYVGLTAFGQTGPYAHRSAFDQIAQSMSGIMSLTGFPGSQPVKAGISISDYGAGLYCAFGIVLALFHRQNTGIGQSIDVSLLDTVVSFLETVLPEYKVLDVIRPQIGNRRPYSAPTDTFKAKDGWVSISISTNALWRRFCRVIGREELVEDPRFKNNDSRAVNHQYLNALAAGWVADKGVNDLIEVLEVAHIPCGKVYSITEVADDQHIRERQMYVELEHDGVGPVPLPGIAAKLSETPGEVRTPAPKVGEHNSEVYLDLLGIDEKGLAQLRSEGDI